MATTEISSSSNLTNKKYGAFLAVDTKKKSYFKKKFVSYGKVPTAPIQVLTDLEKESGDQIHFDLVAQLKMAPIQGDDRLEGKLEKLSLFTQSVTLDQERDGVSAGGKMTRKRTAHDLREVARARIKDWWARNFDEGIFIYLSGARGIDPGFLNDVGYTGRAGNPLTDPTVSIFPGIKIKDNLVAGDKFTTEIIDKAVTKADVTGGDGTGDLQLQTFPIEGDDYYCCIIHPYQAYDLKRGTEATNWLEIQKAFLQGTAGVKSPIFTGMFGYYNGCVIHKHRNVIRFNDYGSGGDVAAARGLFLGNQALVMAYGSASKKGDEARFDWHEEMLDMGNELAIASYACYGMTKTRFDGKDMGVYTMETAAAAP